MLFKDFDYTGTQILEGIDKIKVMLQPAIYHLLSYGKGKQIDHRTAVSLEHTTGVSVPYAKYYIYLNIQGEFIDHMLNMKLNISRALVLLIRKGVLNLDGGQLLDNDVILLSFIYKNLPSFIRGISEVEFFADFRPECISITKDAEIIETSDTYAFTRFKNLPIKDRAGTLIHCQNTYYSYDYKFNRDSTISLYDRATRLLDQRNVYPKQVIKANPYTMRLEFRLKKNNNYKVLAVENLNGDYFDIFNFYAGLLTARFRKYFYGLVKIDSSEHLLFNSIYKGAELDSKIRNTKSVLRSSLDEKIVYRKASDGSRTWHLSDLLKAERNRKSVIQKIPDSMFVNINNKDKIHMPYGDKQNIYYEDKPFTLFNDDFIDKDGNYIPIAENNEEMNITTNNEKDDFSDAGIWEGIFHTPHDFKDKSKIDYEDGKYTIFKGDFIYTYNKDK